MVTIYVICNSPPGITSMKIEIWKTTLNSKSLKVVASSEMETKN